MQPVKLIGVCFSTLHEEDRFNFVAELNKHAVKNGYRLLVFNSCADLYEQSPETNEGASAVFRLIPYDILSAVIIFPNIIYDPEIVEEIRVNCIKRNIPVISMDKDMEGCITFTFNNSNVFEKLCRHVIEDHNAKNILFMAGFLDNVYSQERVEAFRRALELNNLPFIPDNIGYGCFWEQPTIEVLNRWFIEEKREVPDAIICANDLMAITVSDYLQNMGVEIPKDCIVTGFDGIKQVEYLPPRITTCRQDFEKMSSLLIDTLKKISNNIPVEKSYCIDFSIDYSQSCGCQPINYKNVQSSIRALLTSVRKSDERQKMICHTQTSMLNLTDINFLPRFLVRRFKFETCIFLLNDSIFEPPHFGSLYKDENCYSDNVDVMYHCYKNHEYERCRIPTSRLLPRFDLLMENDNPIIICCSHYIDMVMGYCVFQPEIDIDEYEKINTMMTAITSTLGNFHSRVQIRSMNEELQKLSQRDYMTGLFNRRGFYEKMNEAFIDNNYVGSTLLIISADMDRLKYINDTFGHAEGDSAIITIANALVSSSLHSKLCARFGGDEFCAAIFTYSNDPEQVFEEFKVRFLDALVEYNRNSGKPYNVRASIGCSYATVDTDLDIDDLINRADEQMYVYKLAHKRKK
ncbi:MAG: GGDEF domain-containing protein [Ruminococcus sp.]|nr:GGDEF domain-containing protein [Ruminococcus sp.]